MAFTVTANTSGGSTPHMSLKAVVLTSAIEAGGASVNNTASSGAPNFSLTPNFTGGHPFFAIYDGTGGSSGQYTASTNNTLLDNTIGNQLDAFCDGHYSGSTTASTPVTVGCSAPSGSDTQLWAAYEIKPNGTVTIDGSTPAVATAATSAVTTASFTPPNGSVICLLITINSSSGTAIVSSISDTSGLGLTWTQRANEGVAANGTASIYTTTIPGTPVFIAAQPLIIRQAVNRAGTY